MENKWFNQTKDEVINSLKTDETNGLNDQQVLQNQEKYGLNELKAAKKDSLLVKFFNQFKDFMIIVLIIAAIVSGIVGSMQGEGITDTIIIMIVVIVNAIIGVAQEDKAEKSLEALQQLSAHIAKVMRNGELNVIPAKELVPGDIVILQTGDYVGADMRLIEAVNLKAQESSLTGESVPVDKSVDVIDDEKVGIGDRVNMVFSSSLITYGRGKGIVVETGMDTEVGKIAGILNETESNETPLQKKLNDLGKTLGIACLIICAVIFVIGLLYGKNVIDMFMTAVSLAVAAIPEGLAAVSTIVLAIGVQRMVKKNAIIKKLPAVEALGSASVICSDKTGTLTQNKMTVKKVYYNNYISAVENIHEISDQCDMLIKACMLCNDTKVAADQHLTGDPAETALVDMGMKLNYSYDISIQYPRVAEIPFDSDRKLMTTVNKVGNQYIAYTKGGIDELYAHCSHYIDHGIIYDDMDSFKEQVDHYNEMMAKDALRVLAMAYKVLDHQPTADELNTLEDDLIYVGMVGMIDPPREEVEVAINNCKSAGIKTVMITGDHKMTAIAIAKELGILENDSEAITGAELEEMSQEDLKKNIRHYSVYARVSPEHKVRIVKAWQAQGEIVAMTGDGVNDAPALKTADIGCAMGIVGKDVSKEAADVILTDDNFATIVAAVEEGRVIYDNILKAIQFLLSSNIGEIVVLFLAILLTPWISSRYNIDMDLIEILLPIHILWINLVTDSLPALALAVDPAEDDVMKRKPLKTKGIFSKGMTWRIAYQGVMIGLITLAAFLIGLATPEASLPTVYENGVLLSSEVVRVEIGQTMAFVVLALSELVHVFNIRNNKKSIFKTHPFKNKMLLLAELAAASLVFVILLIPQLRSVFSIPVLPVNNILEIIGLVLLPLVIVEIFKLLKINTSKDE
ncbi:MAG: cation-translocating P-type ATPase [Erysipelotrichaceae bacterium]|nr:cation-translocating P-type ATPase [Erysipelotrichaceae bacterium]